MPSLAFSSKWKYKYSSLYNVKSTLGRDIKADFATGLLHGQSSLLLPDPNVLAWKRDDLPRRHFCSSCVVHSTLLSTLVGKKSESNMPRVSQACDNCFRSKVSSVRPGCTNKSTHLSQIKCEGQRPQCEWCEHRKLLCTYDRKRKRAPKKASSR